MALPSTDTALDAVLLPALETAEEPPSIEDLEHLARAAGLVLGPDASIRLRLLLDDLGIGGTDGAGADLPAPVDWPAARARRQAASVARRHGFDEDQQAALVVLFADLARFRNEPTRAEPDAAAVARLDRALADQAVTEAFGYELLTPDPAPAHALDAWAADLIDHGSTGPAARWLRARAVDRLGRADDAALLLDAALACDPDFGPAHELAARDAGDRGDAATARRHLRAAGAADDDDHVVLLERILAAPRPNAERNDPCPCGSGRKFKHCCLVNPRPPLDDRARWLWHKGVQHLHDGPRRWRCVEVAAALQGADTVTPAIAHLALTSTLVADLVLAEDGEWSRFVAQRGPLLPADERDLAERWTGVRRSLFAVVAVDRERDVVVVEDLRPADPDRGERRDPHPVTVPSRSFAAVATVGMVVLTRVLPTGTAHQFFGGVHVLGPGQQEALQALLDQRPDALRVAEHLGAARQAAPRTTAEGEPLVFCAARYRLPDDLDPDAVADELQAAGGLLPAPTGEPAEPAEPAEPGDPAARGGPTGAAPDLPPLLTGAPGPGADAERFGATPTATGRTLVEPVEVDGRSWLRGAITVTTGELVIRTNADARLARLDALVARAVPRAVRIEEERRPATDPDDDPDPG